MGVVQLWRQHAIVAFGLATAGCVTTSQLFPLAYTYNDEPEQKRIEVRYRNTTPRGVCLLPEHWPNKGGKIHQDGDTAFLVVEGRRFALEPFNTGYCPNGCATYLAPGQEIGGFLSYRDFGLPADLEVGEKTLEFAALGFYCPPPKGR
ncbi:hypothetical protein LJR164_002955 [Phenylobacterium sp. LjRoot164]|uniref:hypothetical protein n=1 Tax=unclassified Phenylobacterium TaxID=2640670 RepID=UPI003ECF7B41